MVVRRESDGHSAQDAGKSTKDDWLNLAIATLTTEGIDQVKIQVMAKRLGVSRSSFYWFFDSLQALHDQILDYWLRKNTGPIIERAMRPAASIHKAICNVFECWFDNSLFKPDLDLAVRLWGRHDEKIRAIVDEADRQRVDALTRMFMRYGYPEEEAHTRARVMYYTQIGHFTMQVRESGEGRLSHTRSYLLTFSGTEPDPSEVEEWRAFMTANY